MSSEQGHGAPNRHVYLLNPEQFIFGHFLVINQSGPHLQKLL